MQSYRHIKPSIPTFILTMTLLCFSCKDPYLSPYQSPPTGYLVVEGYISGNTTTQFTLTRTIPLPADTTIPTVDGASVQVEGSDNSTYPLTGMGNGIYSSIDTLKLNPQLQYRLRITTNGDKYLSDLVPYKPTPPIDSINWVQNGDNSIQIYANTHDPANNTHYYQWSYEQTYQYNSAEDSYVYYDIDTVPPAVVNRQLNQQVFSCWLSGSSTNILIASSTKLASDVIYEQPVKQIPPDDIQTSVLYSILVKQYALTDDGYTFLTLMQKNSESLGSIFDAQPTQLTGNIHSLTTPTEQIIGYVSAGTVQQQRIFISRSQIMSNYSYSCPVQDTVMPTDPTDLAKNYSEGLFTPMYYGNTVSHPEFGWISNYTDCLVCTVRGGVNTPPSFWPN